MKTVETAVQGRPLLVAKDADGHRLEFVVMEGGRCAVAREEDVVMVCDADDQGIETALRMFRRLTAPSRLVG
jgi:hypothetical protein